MGIIVKDRVRETTTVTGTGPATLLGALPGFHSFVSKFADSDQTAVLIKHRTSSEWEISHPLYSGGVIDRSNVVDSSNAGNPVDFSAGLKDVYCSIDAATLQLLIPTNEGGSQNQYLRSNGDQSSTWHYLPATGLIAHRTNFNATGYPIIDDNIGNTDITVHSKPADPQYTRTIQGSDIPPPDNGNQVADYMAFFTFGGQNTSGSTDNLNWRFTLNGTDIDSTDGQISVAPGDFYSVTGLFQTQNVTGGCVLGIKVWTDTQTMNYSCATFYIIAKLIRSLLLGFLCTPDSNKNSAPIAGALSGVTYSDMPAPVCYLNDSVSGMTIDPVPANIIQVLPYGFAVYYKGSGSVDDVNNYDSHGDLVTQGLAQIPALSLYSKIAYYTPIDD